MRILHQPVMVEEVLRYLDLHPGATVIDATVGEGGHAHELLTRFDALGRLVGIDRDAQALEVCRERLKPWAERVQLIHARFKEFGLLLEQGVLEPSEGLLMDLGVSSLQIEDPDRGFSYRVDGSLDMRMDQSVGITAVTLIERLSEKELVHLIQQYGEERHARRIARTICHIRRTHPITSTFELAQAVRSAIPSRMAHKSLARVFQALRIVVNDEMAELDRALAELPALLRPQGRCVVISYHSLEDRRVKRCFRELSQKETPVMRILTKKVVRPSSLETSRNPRARSARLRAVERI